MNKTLLSGDSVSAISPTLAVNERVRSLWGQGKNVFHLAFGESRMPLHPKLVSALKENVEQKSYLDSTGLFELRQAIARFHERHFQAPILPENVVVGPGSKALLFGILLGIECDVYLPTPSWVSYAPQAELARRQYRYLKGSFDDGYEITVDSIGESIKEFGTGRLPVLILNSPNNPSGKTLSESKLKELGDFCREKQILVVSDEIYAMTTFDRQRHRSILEFYPEGTIVVGGPSKHLSLGGWRLGTALIPDSNIGLMVASVLQTVASEIWSSPTSAIQYAAIAAYADDEDVDGYIQACTDLHELKTRFISRSFKQMGIRCTDPRGGFYFIANFDDQRDLLKSHQIETSTQLAHFLLVNHEIATLPGTAFGIPEHELSLRIATSYIDMETDGKAQRLMSSFLAKGRMLDRDDLPNTLLAIEQMRNFINSGNT